MRERERRGKEVRKGERKRMIDKRDGKRSLNKSGTD